VLPTVLTGALGVFGVGPGDVEIGLISLSPWPQRADGRWEHTRLERVMGTAMRSFLASVVHALAPRRDDRRHGGRENVVSGLHVTKVAGPPGGRGMR
jgi:hypothetical protein